MRAIFFITMTIILFSPKGYSENACINKTGAHLRFQPKKVSKISWRVPKYMPLKATGKKKNGYLEVLDLDGHPHWARKKDLSFKLNCLVVRTNSVRLKTGPGDQFPAADLPMVEKYYSFIDLGGEDGWTLVQDDHGNKAWVSLDNTWKPSQKIRMSFEANDVQK